MSSRPPPISPVQPEHAPSSYDGAAPAMIETQRAHPGIHPFGQAYPTSMAETETRHHARMPYPAISLPPQPATLPPPPTSPNSPPRSTDPERWSAAPLSRLLSTPGQMSGHPRQAPPQPLLAETAPRMSSLGYGGLPVNQQRPEQSLYPSPSYDEPYRAADVRPQPAPPMMSPTAALSGPLHPTTTLPSPTGRDQGRGGQYEMIVRQQPLAARACGFGERDRRVIDPPPIVQLMVRDSLPGQSVPDELRYPFNVVHCTLWNVNGTNDETALQSQDRKLNRRLMGTLVASPFVGLDENGQEGCFFCFPDLSCRTFGQYRLRFVLMRIEAHEVEPGGYTPILTEATSEVFTVFTAKDFPGMRASTALTKALKQQGCAISVKKGNEKPAVERSTGHAREEDSGGEGARDASHAASSSPSGAAAEGLSGSGKKRRRR